MPVLTATSELPMARGRELFQGSACCETRYFLRAGGSRGLARRKWGSRRASSGRSGQLLPSLFPPLRPDAGSATCLPGPRVPRPRSRAGFQGRDGKPGSARTAQPGAGPERQFPQPRGPRREGGTLHSGCLTTLGNFCGFSGTSRILLSQDQKWGLARKTESQNKLRFWQTYLIPRSLLFPIQLN